MASRSQEKSRQSDSADTSKAHRKYRLEFGVWQLFVSCFAMFLALAWMFTFGILVGRGLPLVGPDEASLRAHVLRFLGLGKEAPPPPENVAEYWESPEKMLQTLDYYHSLAKKSESAPPKPTESASPSSNPDPVKTIRENRTPESATPPPSPLPSSVPSKATVSDRQKTAAQNVPQEVEPPAASSERFTLLASSFRDLENAQRLVARLRSKGYAPRLEAIDMPESGRWNRVLVGSFKTHEEALQFAAEFNRKEGTKGLVIRQSR